MTCPFATLGLARTATQADVMREWRRLLLLVHPDKSDAIDATERTQWLNEAKERAFSIAKFNEDLQREEEEINARYEAQRRAACEAHAQRKAAERIRESERKRAAHLKLIEREKLMAPIRDAYFKRKDALRASIRK